MATFSYSKYYVGTYDGDATITVGSSVNIAGILDEETFDEQFVLNEYVWGDKYYMGHTAEGHVVASDNSDYYIFIKSGSSTTYNGAVPFIAEALAVCFLRGTLILTARGEVPVEALRAGDLVATKFGGLRPIRWIGTQSFHPRFAGRASTPIRFAAGSLGNGVPSTELFVSPGHAMLVQEGLASPVLAHAGALVNGSTITQPAFAGERIDYFHLDLGSHDCVLANGAWAESYFEDRNRDVFHNAASFHEAFPGHEPERQATCLPIWTAQYPLIGLLRARLVAMYGRGASARQAA